MQLTGDGRSSDCDENADYTEGGTAVSISALLKGGPLFTGTKTEPQRACQESREYFRKASRQRPDLNSLGLRRFLAGTPIYAHCRFNVCSRRPWPESEDRRLTGAWR